MNNLRQSLGKDTRKHPLKHTVMAIFYIVSLFAAFYYAYTDDLTLTLFWSLLFLGENIAISIDAIWRVLQNEDE